MDIVILSVPDIMWENLDYINHLEEVFMAMGLNAIILPDTIKVTTVQSMFKEEDVVFEDNIYDDEHHEEDDYSEFFEAYSHMKDIASQASDIFRLKDRD